MIQSHIFHNVDQKPLQVSVVLNIWGNDNEDSLIRSLKSIQSQIHKPDEVLIVVDGPISERMQRIIQVFVKSVSFLVTQIDLPIATGLWNARNAGIHAAEHEFIAVHDADDVMHPDRLRIQLNYFESAEIDVLGTPVYEFDAVNEKVLGLRSLTRNGQLNKKMLWQNVINQSSVMFRKSAVIAVGGYRNVHLAEDYDLWLRLICAGKNLNTTDFVLQAFSVDSQLSKRRGGTKFVASEFALHRLVRSTNAQTSFASWLRLTLRLVYRLGPRSLRNVYRRKFRPKNSQNSSRNLEEFINNPPLNVNSIS
jgi:glycosyltransferase involved in cell wall biosynthesis